MVHISEGKEIIKRKVNRVVDNHKVRYHLLYSKECEVGDGGVSGLHIYKEYWFVTEEARVFSEVQGVLFLVGVCGLSNASVLAIWLHVLHG